MQIQMLSQDSFEIHYEYDNDFKLLLLFTAKYTVQYVISHKHMDHEFVADVLISQNESDDAMSDIQKKVCALPTIASFQEAKDCLMASGFTFQYAAFN